MNDKTLAVLCHVGGLVGSWALPCLGGILTPLLIWGFGKSPNKTLLNQHGKEAINFQISILLYAIIASAILFGGALSFGLAPLISSDENMIAAFIGSGSVLMLGMMTIGVILVFEAICVIIAIIKAANEQDCHYPLTIRFIK